MKDSLALPPQANFNLSSEMEEKLPNIPKTNIFQIPEGYFDVLLPQIQERLKQSTQKPFSGTGPLEDYTPLHDLVKQPVFATPPEYFETLYNRIQIRLQSQPQAKPFQLEALENFEVGLEPKEVYAVPENYFDHLSERILSKIVSAENQKPASLDFGALEESELGILVAIPKQNVFQLPENYFEQFSVTTESVTEKTETEPNQQETKVIRLIPGWARYAASVAAAIAILLTGYWFRPATTQTEDCTELLCNVSDEEILQYLETQDVRFTKIKTDATPAKIQLDANGLDQLEFSDDDLLNAAESIE